MKIIAFVAVCGILPAARPVQAQPIPTNSIRQAQASQIASELRLRMTEEDASRVVETKHGLMLGLRVGGSAQWYHNYRLADETFLDLMFAPRNIDPSGAWKHGLLKSAAITSNGVEVISIVLTNALELDNAVNSNRSRLRADDRTYEQRFSDEYARVGTGWVTNATLVDTNNAGLMLVGKRFLFSRFQSAAGELGGIKLGMTMSEVVAAWGKPHQLFTHCDIGPRFSYGRSAFLFFRDNHLVLLNLGDPFLHGALFDNGFKAGMRRSEVETLLGSSVPPHAKLTDDWQSSLRHISNGICMTVSFKRVSRTATSAFIDAEELDSIAVGFEDEFTRRELITARHELLRVWSDPSNSVQERADAVNQAFTNGTPVSAVVAALGTNYTLCFSSARLWGGPGPEPPNTYWLSYRFGEDGVTIGTSVVFGRDLHPLSAKFTGAGYSFPVRGSPQATNRIWMGETTGKLPEWAKESAETSNTVRQGHDR